MPGWVARRLQGPEPRRVAVKPETEQLAGVRLLMVTGRPELAVAVRSSGLLARVWGPGLGKVMVWVARVMLTVRVMGVAGR